MEEILYKKNCRVAFRLHALRPIPCSIAPNISGKSLDLSRDARHLDLFLGMNRAQKIFLSLTFLFASAVYVLVFGDAGWIVQNRLERQLRELKDNVASLESEKKLLQDRYFQLKENSPAENSKNLQGQEIIILKFRAPHSEFQPNTEEGLSLSEARILYGFAVFFLAVLGYAYLRRFGPSY